LNNLQLVSLNNNWLSGPVPEIQSLPRLQWFFVSYNLLGGRVGEPPPSLLAASLCPNWFAATPSVAWDAITGMAPRYSQCDTEDVFQDGFDFLFP
jgi:hypothetical protein